MKKFIGVTATIIGATMLLAASAHAEQMGQPQQGGAMMMQKAMPQDPEMAASRKAEEELEFKNRKEEMLLRITNRMAMMEKTKACIAAATTRDALQKCKPEGGHPPGGMQGGMQGGGPGMKGHGGGMGSPGMMQGGGMMRGRAGDGQPGDAPSSPSEGP